MNRPAVFVAATIGAGIFAVLGSIIGHLAGHTGVFVGAVIGGLAGVAIAMRIAVSRHWIERENVAAATIGGGIGFLFAAWVAVKTLSSPVGPVLSSLLVGLGALAGVYLNALGEREGL